MALAMKRAKSPGTYTPSAEKYKKKTYKYHPLRDLKMMSGKCSAQAPQQWALSTTVTKTEKPNLSVLSETLLLSDYCEADCIVEVT